MNMTDDFPTELVAPSGYIWRLSRTARVEVSTLKEAKLYLFMGVLPVGW